MIHSFDLTPVQQLLGALSIAALSLCMLAVLVSVAYALVFWSFNCTYCYLTSRRWFRRMSRQHTIGRKLYSVTELTEYNGYPESLTLGETKTRLYAELMARERKKK